MPNRQNLWDKRTLEMELNTTFEVENVVCYFCYMEIGRILAPDYCHYPFCLKCMIFTFHYLLLSSARSY